MRPSLLPVTLCLLAACGGDGGTSPVPPNPLPPPAPVPVASVTVEPVTISLLFA